MALGMHPAILYLRRNRDAPCRTDKSCGHSIDYTPFAPAPTQTVLATRVAAPILLDEPDRALDNQRRWTKTLPIRRLIT